MNVVVVNENIGYPMNSGNRIRTLNLLLPLAARHRITYVCRGVADPRNVREAKAFFADHGIRPIISADHAPSKSGWRFYGGLAANVVSPLPYSIASHNSRLVRNAVRAIAAAEPVDLWQFETLSYADALPNSSAPRVLIAHNVESVIWRRRYQSEANRFRRLYFLHQWRKYERYEAKLLRSVEQVVAVSDDDARVMRDAFGVTRVSVIENGVDIDHFANAARSRHPTPRELLFLGSLDWHPNIDGVEVFLRNVMPAIRVAEPSVTLRIVGRNPPVAFERWVKTLPGVELHANVPDVRPYLANASAMVVPLRIGGGSRLKILEAAAAAVPIVSTRIGAEGLAIEHNRHALLAEDITAMTRPLLELLRHPSRAQALAHAAMELANERYSWTLLADRLEGVWWHLVRPATVIAR